MSAKFPRGEQNHFQPSVYSPRQDPATAFTIQYAHCKAIHFKFQGNNFCWFNVIPGKVFRQVD